MKRRRIASTASDLWKRRRAKLRLDCRECEVICERVVWPWHCLRSSCRYVYMYHDSDTAYFGCLHKIFAPDLDMTAFEVLQSKRRGSDPYGPLRANRSPRPECRVTIEQAYSADSSQVTCCNPTFFHHPASRGGESIRLTTNRLDDPDLDRRN